MKVILLKKIIYHYNFAFHLQKVWNLELVVLFVSDYGTVSSEECLSTIIFATTG